ncbi:hypothetical protein BVSY1_09330 [Bacillus velezensis]|nr:hypothetical protein BVSY1_09330 [Bacillus velezensis]
MGMYIIQKDTIMETGKGICTSSKFRNKRNCDAKVDKELRDTKGCRLNEHLYKRRLLSKQ